MVGKSKSRDLAAIAAAILAAAKQQQSPLEVIGPDIAKRYPGLTAEALAQVRQLARGGAAERIGFPPAPTGPPKRDDRLLAARRVWERYNIHQRTLYRWIDDPEIGFPKPLVIKRKLFFHLSELEAWELDRARRRSRPERIAERSKGGIKAHPVE